MARPLGNTYAVRESSIEDLREAFLANASAKNLAVRTIEWYERHTAGLRDWLNARGIDAAVQLGASHLDDYLLSLRAYGAADHTVRGAAQVAKTLARFGYRRGYLPEEITRDFSLPKVAQTIIVTFTDEQLHALLDAPDQRRWVGVRDRAILVLLLDTPARISEISGLNLADVDLEGRSIRVMGKGRKQRTSLAMVRRYVELASADVRVQHERFSPADTLLRRPHPR